MREDEIHIFISHCTRDEGAAPNLADKLEPKFKCWYTPRDLEAGVDWPEAIESALKACSVFVVILTPEANKSRDVKKEILIADQLHKPILPILVGDFELGRGLTYRLAGIQHLSWKTFEDIDYSRISKEVELCEERTLAAAQGEFAAPVNEPASMGLGLTSALSTSAEVEVDAKSAPIEMSAEAASAAMGSYSTPRPSPARARSPRRRSREKITSSIPAQRETTKKLLQVLRQFRYVPAELKVLVSRYAKRVDPALWKGKRKFEDVEEDVLGAVEDVADVLRRLRNDDLRMAPQLRIDIKNDVDEAFRATNAALAAMDARPGDEATYHRFETCILHFRRLAKRYRKRVRNIYFLRHYRVLSGLAFAGAAAIAAGVWCFGVDLVAEPALSGDPAASERARSVWDRYRPMQGFGIAGALVIGAFFVGLARPRIAGIRVFLVAVGILTAAAILQLLDESFRLDLMHTFDSIETWFAKTYCLFADYTPDLNRRGASCALVAGALFLIKDNRSAQRPAWWKVLGSVLAVVAAIILAHALLSKIFGSGKPDPTAEQFETYVFGLQITASTLIKAALTSSLVLAITLLLKKPWVFWGIERDRKVLRSS